MILNGDPFTEGIIGTTFMFGALEYYAKESPNDIMLQKEYQKDLKLVKEYTRNAIEKAMKKVMKKKKADATLITKLETHSNTIGTSSDWKQIALALKATLDTYNLLGIGTK